MGIRPVRHLHNLALWNVSGFAEIRCVAFEIDTIKLLMSMFVRDLVHPSFVPFMPNFVCI